ncbi:MAG: 1-deoxy-D-xylulose-5-phosphate reductoisomerase [Deltaproteobacteria bacterium]|nr:1-deoxy-D-xylulose-5-phosphate reductoisomerase [Deltaproteobacteria bacterium]
MKNVVILGSTGSVGKNTIQIITRHPRKFKVLGISGFENIELLREQTHLLKPEVVVANNRKDKIKLEKDFPYTKILYGEEGLCELASHHKAHIVVNALAGSAGLLPTYSAIQNNRKRLALANKESLVMWGKKIMEKAKENHVEIIPVDSEHNALFQCLKAGKKREINRLILTASGGPFLHIPKENFSHISPEDALRHPSWVMGKKITIDSATLMNKGFEIIEAHHLFNIESSKIDVVIHPQSIIHSAVEFKDASIIAQIASPDMRIPISYALFYPQRCKLNYTVSLNQLPSLTFEKPDTEKFNTLNLARYALQHEDKNYGIVLNAADEAAVKLFLNKKITFDKIFDILEKSIHIFKGESVSSIYDIKKFTNEIIRNIEKHKGNI